VATVTRPSARPPLYTRRPFLAGVLRQWPLVLVLAVVAAGLLEVTFEHWRRGLVTMGVALVLAGVLRLVLPVRRVGFLAVRSRAVDVTLTAGCGLLLVVIALAVPGG
jgi:MFS superfamily sulfate permease-like transporter